MAQRAITAPARRGESAKRGYPGESTLLTQRERRNRIRCWCIRVLNLAFPNTSREREAKFVARNRHFTGISSNCGKEANRNDMKSSLGKRRAYWQSSEEELLRTKRTEKCEGKRLQLSRSNFSKETKKSFMMPFFNRLKCLKTAYFGAAGTSK